MPTRSLRFPLAGLLLLAAACTTGRHSPTGFRLPTGDPERGKIAFARFECHTCHEVSGGAHPAPTAQPPVPIVLGGPVDIEKTNGYLVSAIIHPSHQIVRAQTGLVTIGQNSRMPSHNHSMTVQELTDLVEYLQSLYTLRRPPLISEYY